MSDAATNLNFAESDDAERIPLGLPEQDAEMTPKEPSSEEKHGSREKTLAASIATSFERIRAEFMGRLGNPEEGMAESASWFPEMNAGRSAPPVDESDPAPRAPEEEPQAVSSDPLWRRYKLATSASVIALAVAAISAVALWPNGGALERTAREKGVDTSLIAPASKLAAVPLHERVEPPVIEIPAASPPQKVAEEVESFWASGAEKDRDKPAIASSQLAPLPAPSAPATVDEIGVRASATAVEPPKPANARASEKPIIERQPARAISAVPSAPTLAGEPIAKASEEPSRRGASIPLEPVMKAEEKAHEQETRLYSMITELSTLVRRTREEVAALQESDKRTARAIDAKLTDFERRLNLGEAQRALDAAKAVSTAPKEAPPSAPPAPNGATKGLVAASLTTRAEPASVSPGARYRVQAASPGLAMLSEIDRSGEEAAPLQVAVGASVPGYGRVTKISQRGTEWVVLTEKGPIR